jgi:hypothetical protein
MHGFARAVSTDQFTWVAQCWCEESFESEDSLWVAMLALHEHADESGGEEVD